MQVWRSTRWSNPAAWYTALGVVLLVISMWVPWLTAERTARIEGRAEQLSGVLLQTAAAQWCVLDASNLDLVMARFYAAAASAGLFTGDIEIVEPPPAGVLLLLTNKHYAFQLAEAPLDAHLVAGRGTVPAYEVVAWPLSSVGPGHSVFFQAEDAPRAFSRNLGSGFVGIDQGRPAPGACQRPRDPSANLRLSYRARDDKRWIQY